MKLTVPERGEVFTHKDNDGTLRTFAVELMKQFAVRVLAGHKVHPKLFFGVEKVITQTAVDHIRKNMGIEQDRLDRLATPHLDAPGIAIMWDEKDDAGNNLITIVDGNHRIVKRHELGIEKMRFFIFHPLLWQQFVLDIPDQEARLTAPSGVIEHEKMVVKE